MLLRHVYSEAPFEVTVQHIVFRVAGEYIYDFHYELDDPANTALETIFRESATTIIIEGYDPELTKSRLDTGAGLLGYDPLVRPPVFKRG